MVFLGLFYFRAGTAAAAASSSSTRRTKCAAPLRTAHQQQRHNVAHASHAFGRPLRRRRVAATSRYIHRAQAKRNLSTPRFVVLVANLVIAMCDRVCALWCLFDSIVI